MFQPSRTLVALVTVRVIVAVGMVAGSVLTLSGWGRVVGLLVATGWIALSVYWVRLQMREEF